MRLALALLAAAAMLGGGAQHRTITITVDGTAFTPADVTVHAGDTVTWINKDPFPHTATAKGVFDSRDIGAGRSWSYRPTRAGEVHYICRYHPTMTGTLRVE